MRAHREKAPRILVGRLTRRQRQQHHRHDLYKSDKPERPRRASPIVELPPDRDRQHLRAQHRDDAPDGKPPDSWNAQSCQRVGLSHGPRNLPDRRKVRTGLSAAGRTSQVRTWSATQRFMSENQSAGSASEPSRVTSVTIDQYTALGQKVRLDLGKRRTALVGHNGAGKSAILEAISRGLRNPLAPVKGEARTEPYLFEVLLETAHGTISYDYDWDHSPFAPESAVPRWSEKLRLDGKELWLSEWGRATWDERTIGQVSAGLDLLGDFHLLDDLVGPSSSLPESLRLSAIARPLMTLCASSRHVPAGVPRPLGQRAPISFALDEQTRQWLPTTSDRSRVTVLFSQMLKSLEAAPATFEEFRAICSRLRLLKEFDFFRFSPPKAAPAGQDLGALICDGVNAALLSDGTLRVMEIVWALLNTEPGALLAIEEPETGIHPGLLAALLSEIDAYLDDRQVLLSTHSPMVIDRVDAHEIRLVTRLDEKTLVEPISAPNMERLRSYLHFEGELAGFVFDGGLH